MPLQFKQPFEIKQAKTKEEALADAVAPTIQSLPALYLQYKNQRDQTQREALAAKRDAGYKNVQQKIELLKLGRGQAVFNSETGKTDVFPGVTGYRIDFDGDGVPDLVPEGSNGAQSPVTDVSVPPATAPAPAVNPGVSSVKLTPTQKSTQSPAGDKSVDPDAAAKKLQAVSDIKANLDTIKDVRGRLGATTTGIGGLLLRNLPATEAKNVDELLVTLKANLSFDKLQKMREASKTGGALGQVSDIENKKLENAVAALNQTAKEKFTREQLDKVEKSLANVRLLMDADANSVVVNSQEEYDALPPGTVYADSEGNIARKQ